MPLESTMICLDNSEWMRNGDYLPTRMGAQHDAANVLCGSKTNSNPESTVGILTMAGKSVECLASPTEDIGKLLAVIHNIPIGGKSRFVNAILVAQLALKHRRNKKGGQRIIMFVGSPVEDDEKALTKIGKLLKKNNVAADVICFGDIEDNQAKLQAFVDAANSSNNSHLVTIPVGLHPPDVLVSSPIILGGDSGATSSDGGAALSSGENFAEYGGVDPSMDPELALALRVSMEEERARQEAASKKSAEDTQPTMDTQASQGKPANQEESADAVQAEDDDQLLSKAIAMSMPSENDEDEAMQIALQMSMQQPESKSTVAGKSNSSDADSKGSSPPPPAPASAASFLDPSFVNSLLSDLPGVDPNDPKIQAAMAQINAQSNLKKDDESKKDDSK